MVQRLIFLLLWVVVVYRIVPIIYCGGRAALINSIVICVL